MICNRAKDCDASNICVHGQPHTQESCSGYGRCEFEGFEGNKCEHILNRIIDFQEGLPHLTIQGVERIHVIPLSCIEKVISGTMNITDIEDYKDMLPAILKEWLEM